jgi:hypothetical protein
MYFAHENSFSSAVVRPLSVCFAVAVCCRLNQEPVRLLRRHQQLRNQLITFLTSLSTIRSSIALV